MLWGIVVLEVQRIPRDIVPFSALEPDPAINSYQFKSQRMVKAFTRFIRKCDAGVRIVESLQPKHPEELSIENTRHAAAAMRGMGVGRHLDRPLIRRAVTMLR